MRNEHIALSEFQCNLCAYRHAYFSLVLGQPLNYNPKFVNSYHIAGVSSLESSVIKKVIQIHLRDNLRFRIISFRENSFVPRKELDITFSYCAGAE